MNNLHAIVVRYVRPSATKLGRISFKSGRHWAEASSKLVPWNHAAGSRLEDQAASWLTSRGFTVRYSAEINERESVILVREFCTLDEDPAEWRANHC